MFSEKLSVLGPKIKEESLRKNLLFTLHYRLRFEYVFTEMSSPLEIERLIWYYCIHEKINKICF